MLSKSGRAQEPAVLWPLLSCSHSIKFGENWSLEEALPFLSSNTHCGRQLLSIWAESPAAASSEVGVLAMKARVAEAKGSEAEQDARPSARAEGAPAVHLPTWCSARSRPRGQGPGGRRAAPASPRLTVTRGVAAGSPGAPVHWLCLSWVAIGSVYCTPGTHRRRA